MFVAWVLGIAERRHGLSSGCPVQLDLPFGQPPACRSVRRCRSRARNGVAEETIAPVDVYRKCGQLVGIRRQTERPPIDAVSGEPSFQTLMAFEAGSPVSAASDGAFRPCRYSLGVDRRRGIDLGGERRQLRLQRGDLDVKACASRLWGCSKLSASSSPITLALTLEKGPQSAAYDLLAKEVRVRPERTARVIFGHD